MRRGWVQRGRRRIGTATSFEDRSSEASGPGRVPLKIVLRDEIRQASVNQLERFPSGLGLVLVKRSDDSLGGSQQAAVLDCFRDSAVIEMFAADDRGD